MPVIPSPPAFPTGESGFGPCAAWEPIWCIDLPTGSEEISGTMIAAATEILWAKSGMRYDQCELTIRPCRRSCWGEAWPFGGGQWWEFGTPYPAPALINGNWYNITCGDCTDGCSCTRVEQILLPGPITSITQVKVDGVVLPATAYRLDDYRKLLRVDGEIWPICNDLNLEDTEVGTWSVTLVYGEPVPVMARLAVGELALQLIYACLGSDCCILPYNVSQLARQGVTIELPAVKDLVDMNLIGLQMCDLFLNAGNPYGLRAPSQVYNLDSPRYTIPGTG